MKKREISDTHTGLVCGRESVGKIVRSTRTHRSYMGRENDEKRDGQIHIYTHIHTDLVCGRERKPAPPQHQLPQQRTPGLELLNIEVEESRVGEVQNAQQREVCGDRPHSGCVVCDLEWESEWVSESERVRE